MKDIKKEKQEKTNWLSKLESAGELASGGLFLKNLIGRATAPATRFVPYEGPAVGMPFNGVVPNAAQAFRGLVEGGEAAVVPTAAQAFRGLVEGGEAAGAIGAEEGSDDELSSVLDGSGSRILFFVAEENLEEELEKLRAA